MNKTNTSIKENLVNETSSLLVNNFKLTVIQGKGQKRKMNMVCQKCDQIEEKQWLGIF